jgi:pimeloyl-ACP methyl ester carboxylesterase
VVKPPAFKTDEARFRYQAMYDKTLDKSGVPVRQSDIETALGTTHVIEAGSGTAPPLVLLHGATFSATSWVSNLAAFAGGRRVVALDTVGDVNLSRASRRVRGLDDLDEWLTQALDALDIERCAVAGHSYGGWMAAALASRHPDRVSHLVLLSPALVFVRFSAAFYRHSLRLLGRQSPEKTRAFLGFFFVDGAPQGDAQRQWREQYGEGSPYWRGLLTPPRGLFSDDEIRRITASTLLIEGRQERIHDSAKAVARARALLPSISTVVLENSCHTACLEQPEAVNRLVLDHLAG